MESFQLDPVMLAGLIARQWVWMPFVLILSLIRTLSSRGAARAFAALSAGIAVAAILTTTLPALGLYPAPFAAPRVASGWGGLGAPLTASAPLLLSALLPGRRWWALDAVHAAGLAVLLALTLWTAFA